MDIRGFDPKKPYQPIDSYICDTRTQTYISHADKIKPGTKVKFKPLGSLGLSAPCGADQIEAVGTIIYVNREHNWFGVEYGDDRARISFTLGDIGDTVHICEEE